MQPIPTRDQYTEHAEAFRAHLREQADRPRDEQEWPEDTDAWLAYPVTVICQTAGCPAHGVPQQIDLHEQADGLYRSTCYPCGRAHATRWAAFADQAVDVGTPEPEPQVPPEDGEVIPPDDGGLWP